MSAGATISQYDAVLLMAYGGPTCPEQVEPFLRQLFGNRPLPHAHIQEISRRYQLIGGASPLVQTTARQAEALQRRLAHRGIEIAVRAGMRTGSPSIRDALKQLVDGGAHHILGIVMTPFEGNFSHGRYLGELQAALNALGPDRPVVACAPSFHACDGFIRAHADRLIATLADITPPQSENAAVIFSAHSVPMAANDSIYAEQIARSAERIAVTVGQRHYDIAYQSRSSPSDQPWLGPSILRVIEERTAGGARQLVVVPIGFISDNLEVLYDLDIEASAVAARGGAMLHRSPTIGDHPAFIDALAELVLSPDARRCL
jgi:ferrochelatase